MINFREGWRRNESNGFNGERPDQKDRKSAEAMNNYILCPRNKH